MWLSFMVSYEIVCWNCPIMSDKKYNQGSKFYPEKSQPRSQSLLRPVMITTLFFPEYSLLPPAVQVSGSKWYLCHHPIHLTWLSLLGGMRDSGESEANLDYMSLKREGPSNYPVWLLSSAIPALGRQEDH